MNISILLSKKYWHAIILLTQNALIRQHRNTILGNLWNLIQPFTHIIIISFFFGFLLRQSPEVIAGNLVSSLPFWSFLSASLINASGSLLCREGILKKVIISRSLFPITDVLLQAYILLYSFAAMYFAYCLVFPYKFTWLFLLIPIVAIPLIVTVLSLSVAVSFLTPYIRDVPQMISLVLNVAYWTVPIIYPYSMVPESKRIFFELNPLFCLIRPMQLVINEHELPSLVILAKATLVSIISISVSYFIHKKLSRNVVFYL
jgi:lipopolysaccharide transport system permease protein